jgi:beta-glucanase (GH16 family)
MKTIDPPSTRLITALAIVLTCVLSAPAQAPKWTLTFSDEFSGPANSPPDPKKWAFDLSDNQNHELETYTTAPANVHQQDGDLVITALKEKTTRPDGTTRDYTSARLFTKGLFAQTYGRFEARIKMPLGKGIWPAFWMLGDDIATAGWPKSGEIDIVENIGEPTLSHSTIHGPGYSGDKGPSAAFTLPTGQRVDTAFHTYALEWAPNDLKFFLDDHLIAERTPADLPAGATWVYNHPFFIILNLAVGGEWPGNPDSSTTFPQQMLVDYVRVYKPADRTVHALPSSLTR